MSKLKENNKNIFLFILLGVSALGYYLLADYLLVIILSFFMAIAFEPLYKVLFKYVTRGRKMLANAIALLIVAIGVLIPLMFVGNIIINQTIAFSSNINEVMDLNNLNVGNIVDTINTRLEPVPGYQPLSIEELNGIILRVTSQVPEIVISNVGSVGAISASVVINVIIFFVLFATFLPNTQEVIKTIKKFSPLSDEVDDLYINRVIAMSRSMLQGTFLIALTQATVAGISLYLVGVDYTIFWVIVMIVMGVIPMIGTSFVAVPIGIVLILTGNVIPGLFVVLFNLLVVAQIDNLMRLTMVPKSAHMHPALVLLSLFGGLRIFGALGFLYGPVIMILLVTTFEVYSKYYLGKSHK